MKINFKQLKLKSLSGMEFIDDVREVVAETIYAKTGGLACKLLAEKIYQSNGEINLDEKESQILKQTISPDIEFYSSKLRDAVEVAIKEGEEV